MNHHHQHARTCSAVLHGAQGHVVAINATIGGGNPGLQLADRPHDGLPEARDRVRAAVVNSGLSWPTGRIDLTLPTARPTTPASRFDVALACAVLGASGALPQDALNGVVILGELGLDGTLRPVRGVLPSLLAARAAGIDRAIVPAAAVPEAHLVEGMVVYGATTLRDAVVYLHGLHAPARRETRIPGLTAVPLDLLDVQGQDDAKHALEVAAAGGHHLMLVGRPGTGATMLAHRSPAC